MHYLYDPNTPQPTVCMYTDLQGYGAGHICQQGSHPNFQLQFMERAVADWTTVSVDDDNRGEIFVYSSRMAVHFTFKLVALLLEELSEVIVKVLHDQIGGGLKVPTYLRVNNTL
eukprot:jgi/Botrbrau1/10159/Bobra.0121s0011.1